MFCVGVKRPGGGRVGYDFIRDVKTELVRDEFFSRTGDADT